MNLIAVGDNVVDYYKDREEMFPGGNALNVAVFCKRYGVNKSSYMGIVGNDVATEHVLNALGQEEIDILKVRQAFGPNGEAVVSLNEEGDRIFVGPNKGGVQSFLKLLLTENDLSYISSHDLLHTSVFSHLGDELPALAERIAVSFDFSTRREENYLKKVCPHLHYAFFSGSDLSKSQCIELIQQAHQLGTKVVGITRGGSGALFSDNQDLYEQPIVEAHVIDTLCAGDSFISMFLTQYHQHRNMSNALAFNLLIDPC